MAERMGSDFHFREKVSVGILGATGTVGQKFVELLASHPWFQITAVAASENSVGKTYKDAVKWMMPVELPEEIGKMKVQECVPGLKCDLIFSGLDSSVAGPIETAFANAGYIVISNSKNHRMDSDVPLVVPEVNSEHLELIKHQKFDKKGALITTPNCSTIGLVVALKPLQQLFGVEKVHVVTMQALSGAGYPGVPSVDIMDNIIPFIEGEEEKLQTEPKKIFGQLSEGGIVPSDLIISAQCNRVPVTHGHMECVSVKLKNKAEKGEIIDAWENFRVEQQRMLPLAPAKPIIYYNEKDYPQPRIHREKDKGMVVSIGRLEKCPVLDYKFVLLSHNTIRGAAGGAILNAEVMLKSGLIYW